MVWASGGGLLGLWVTGLSWWDRAYQKEVRTATRRPQVEVSATPL